MQQAQRLDHGLSLVWACLADLCAPVLRATVRSPGPGLRPVCRVLSNRMAWAAHQATATECGMVCDCEFHCQVVVLVLVSLGGVLLL